MNNSRRRPRPLYRTRDGDQNDGVSQRVAALESAQGQHHNSRKRFAGAKQLILPQVSTETTDPLDSADSSRLESSWTHWPDHPVSVDKENGTGRPIDTTLSVTPKSDSSATSRTMSKKIDGFLASISKLVPPNIATRSEADDIYQIAGIAVNALEMTTDRQRGKHESAYSEKPTFQASFEECRDDSGGCSHPSTEDVRTGTDLLNGMWNTNSRQNRYQRDLKQRPLHTSQGKQLEKEQPNMSPPRKEMRRNGLDAFRTEESTDSWLPSFNNDLKGSTGIGATLSEIPSRPLPSEPQQTSRLTTLNEEILEDAASVWPTAFGWTSSGESTNKTENRSFSAKNEATRVRFGVSKDDNVKETSVWNPSFDNFATDSAEDTFENIPSKSGRESFLYTDESRSLFESPSRRPNTAMKSKNTSLILQGSSQTKPIGPSTPPLPIYNAVRNAVLKGKSNSVSPLKAKPEDPRANSAFSPAHQNMKSFWELSKPTSPATHDRIRKFFGSKKEDGAHKRVSPTPPENPSWSAFLESSSVPSFEEFTSKLREKALKEIKADEKTIQHLFGDANTYPDTLPANDSFLADNPFNSPLFDPWTSKQNKRDEPTGRTKASSIDRSMLNLKIVSVEDAKKRHVRFGNSDDMAPQISARYGANISKKRFDFESQASENDARSKNTAPFKQSASAALVSSSPVKAEPPVAKESPSHPRNDYWLTYAGVRSLGSFDSESAVNNKHAVRRVGGIGADYRIPPGRYPFQSSNASYIGKRPGPTQRSGTVSYVPVTEQSHALVNDGYSDYSSEEQMAHSNPLPHFGSTAWSDLSESQASDAMAVKTPRQRNGLLNPYDAQPDSRGLMPDTITECTTCSESERKSRRTENTPIAHVKSPTTRNETRSPICVETVHTEDTDTLADTYVTEYAKEDQPQGCSLICGAFDFSIKGFPGFC